jgi:hypothetical protein
MSPPPPVLPLPRSFHPTLCYAAPRPCGYVVLRRKAPRPAPLRPRPPWRQPCRTPKPHYRNLAIGRRRRPPYVRMRKTAARQGRMIR